MVCLPSPVLSPAPESESGGDDSRRGPSEPVVLIPPRLNGQSIVQSHHDDPVANQIAPATNQNHQHQIQSLQSGSSPRVSHESVRLSTLFEPRDESEHHTYFWFVPIIGDALEHRSNQVSPLTGNCTACAQNGSSHTTPCGNS